MHAVEEARPTSWAFEPGAQVAEGRTAVRLMGGGDRFEAWFGWDDHLSAPVVLKMLRRDQIDSTRARQAMRREAATLRRLAHPAIVRLFDEDTIGEWPYLMLEFLDGPRLSTLVRRFGALSHEQLVPLGLEIGSALAYMHNEGLVHLDVKPQNVIMGAPPRLIDMSIARRQDELAALSGPMGTEAYMAPEQAIDGSLSGSGPWSDVWGLGATLYEAANGHRPFRRAGPGEAATQLTEDPRPYHPRVPTVLRDLLSRCLQREPSARPSIQQLSDELETLLPASREEAIKRLRRRVR